MHGANWLSLRNDRISSRNKDASKSVTFAIYGVDGDKSGHGAKTGVDLWWYDTAEWKKLSDEEKEELWEWQKNNLGKKATEDQYSKKVWIFQFQEEK